MKKHLLSIDKFHQQKNLEYVKLLNRTVSNASKITAKKRVINMYNKCPTQSFDEGIQPDKTTSSGQTGYLSTFLTIKDNSHELGKSLHPSLFNKRIEGNSNRSMRFAMNPEHQEDIFENEYLRERLRLTRIQQCRVKKIVFEKSEEFEAFESLKNSKAFKIRSRKFQLFGETVKSKRKNSDVQIMAKNAQDLDTAETSKTVQL